MTQDFEQVAGLISIKCNTNLLCTCDHTNENFP